MALHSIFDFSAFRRGLLAVSAGFLGCLFLLAANCASAQVPDVIPKSGNGQDANRYELTLAQLAGSEKPVRLTSTAASARFSLPLPALRRAESLKLILAGVASIALIEGSQLEVRVNGHTSHQFALREHLGSFRREIAIPIRLLHDGFNEIEIAVAQHYTDRCEYPMAPELWTELNLSDSVFVISAPPKEVPLRLDRLDKLLDKAGFEKSPVVPVFTAAEPTQQMLSALALVAQGIGQRYDYVPVRITTARLPSQPASVAGMFPPEARGAVVLGTFEQLGPYLSGMNIPADAGPVAVLRTLPGDPFRYLLLLTAANEADVAVAAAAFALPRMPWPDRSWAAISTLKLPADASAHPGTSALRPSTDAFPLRSLGYATRTFTGIGPGRATVRFWNGSWQGRAHVRLHLAYGAGMSSQSVFNVGANGIIHGSIPLERPNGGIYDNYAVSLPTGALRPGWNTLELEPVLIPVSNGGDCKPFFPGNLTVTVYDDSTLQNFSGSPLQRPDLALLAGEGHLEEGGESSPAMALRLTDTGDGTLGAGLTLMAKLSQIVRAPLLRARLGVGPAEAESGQIWLGPLNGLPEHLRSAIGLAEAERLRIAVPVAQAIAVPAADENESLRRLRELLTGSDRAPPFTTAADAELNEPLGGRSLAATVIEAGHPVAVFTASTPDALLAGMHDLVGYGQWAQLRGGLALWRPGSTEVQAISAEDAPFTAYTLRGGLGLWVSRYPLWALLILLGIMAAMVMITRVVLAAYRRRNLPSQVGRRREDGSAQ